MLCPDELAAVYDLPIWNSHIAEKSQSSKTGWQRTKLKGIHHTIVVAGDPAEQEDTKR